MKLQDRFKMRTRVVFFLCMLLISCSGNKVEIPEGVLSQEKMAAVMADMNLMEASMNMNISNATRIGNGADLQSTALKLLKKNGVTKEQYQVSFNFYTEHPALLSEVYKMALNNLSQLQATVANEKDSTETKVQPAKKP